MATPISLPAFLVKLVYSQHLVRIPEVTADFSGQTIVVTGSNTGLGLEAARLLVRLGAAKVILAVRTVAKGEAAAADILESTRATKNTVETWPLDLSDVQSIKAFAARVSKLDRLDAVIQNAGVMTQNFKLVDESESHIAINVIGAVLLGLLVLPKLRETGKKYQTRTRLSFVGSDLHYVAKFSEANTSGSLLGALNTEEKTDMGGRYSTSKLLLLYAVREIAARSPLSEDSNVIINVMTPGACKTNLFRDDVTWLVLAFQHLVFSIFARSAEVGGRTLVSAVRPDLESDAHGAFLMDCRVADNGPVVESPTGGQLQARFARELFAKLESIAPGVTQF